MFDKQAVEEYRKQTAPAFLKDRVMVATTVKKPAPIRFIPVMGTLAACLALLITATALWFAPSSEVTVSTNGILLADDAQVMTVTASPRLPTAYSAVITLEGNGDMTVKTEDVFYIEENGVFVPLSSPHRAEDTLTLYWSVTAPSAQLTVNGKQYTLYADLEAETVSILPCATH